MILLLDIGNTHVHLGLAGPRRVGRHDTMATRELMGASGRRQLARFVGRQTLEGAAFCSVVPAVSRQLPSQLKRQWSLPCLELTCRTVRGVGVRYPRPETIGPDRLANAVAAVHRYGAPSVTIDFGTATTFDVVDGGGSYVGGIIAPGLAAMTDYLHERTALLPRIRLRETRAVVGKSTEQAMLIGAVHGYRGMIRELLARLQSDLRHPTLPVVATGGCARLIARGMPEINHVDERLTLEGLRLTWQAHR